VTWQNLANCRLRSSVRHGAIGPCGGVAGGFSISQCNAIVWHTVCYIYRRNRFLAAAAGASSSCSEMLCASAPAAPSIHRRPTTHARPGQGDASGTRHSTLFWLTSALMKSEQSVGRRQHKICTHANAKSRRWHCEDSCRESTPVPVDSPYLEGTGRGADAKRGPWVLLSKPLQRSVSPSSTPRVQNSSLCYDRRDTGHVQSWTFGSLPCTPSCL